jgi:hypothetical protein
VSGICQMDRTMADSSFLDSCLRDLTGSWSKLVTGKTTISLIVCTEVSDMDNIRKAFERHENINISKSSAGLPLELPGSGASTQRGHPQGSAHGDEQGTTPPEGQETPSIADLVRESTVLRHSNEPDKSSQSGANDFARAPGAQLPNQRPRRLLDTPGNRTVSIECKPWGTDRQVNQPPNALQLGMGPIQHPQTPGYLAAATSIASRSGRRGGIIQPPPGFQSFPARDNPGGFTDPSRNFPTRNSATNEMVSGEGMHGMQTNDLFETSPTGTGAFQFASGFRSHPPNAYGGSVMSHTTLSQNAWDPQFNRFSDASLLGIGTPPGLPDHQPYANGHFGTPTTPHYGNGQDALAANLNQQFGSAIDAPTDLLNGYQHNPHQPFGQLPIGQYTNGSSYNLPPHLQPHIPALDGGVRPIAPSHLNHSVAPADQDSTNEEALKDLMRGVYHPYINLRIDPTDLS